eukprot:gnl/TRDRNA2_/TRDRNA2_65508_c0_seq1.p1 gnl/TRDRNA2_/TRDRNA2_65508_c0~~gnl/TRDRNA2_/TRDRNA2_65508_c0_seq1.p1  ORF type:complete len:258 (+),score=51.30 gnl/TRDRNA2_/TRDRNA2_65508_c0_seq1:90-863(+)
MVWHSSAKNAALALITLVAADISLVWGRQLNYHCRHAPCTPAHIKPHHEAVENSTSSSGTMTLATDPRGHALSSAPRRTLASFWGHFQGEQVESASDEAAEQAAAAVASLGGESGELQRLRHQTLRGGAQWKKSFAGFWASLPSLPISFPWKKPEDESKEDATPNLLLVETSSRATTSDSYDQLNDVLWRAEPQDPVRHDDFADSAGLLCLGLCIALVASLCCAIILSSSCLDPLFRMPANCPCDGSQGRQKRTFEH